MPIGALDSTIFADMFGTAAMRKVFGDDAFLMRCAEVEAALARAQGRLGIIPAEAAEAITHAANSLASGRDALDLARLKRETETVGYPILPLVRQMAELVGRGGALSALGRHHPGHHGYRSGAADPRRAWR